MGVCVVGTMEERETATAKTAVERFHHTHRKRGRYQRVAGVATGFE